MQNNITSVDISIYTLCKLIIYHQGLCSCQIQHTPKVQSKKYPYSETVSIFKKGCGSDIGCSMNKFWEHSEWNIPVTSGQIRQDSINMRFLELANTTEQEQRMSGGRGKEDGKLLLNGCIISLGNDKKEVLEIHCSGHIALWMCLIPPNCART